MEVRKLSKEDWKQLCGPAHLTCFQQVRSPELDRIDFALITVAGNTPCAFVTIREIDAESLYWQYGGAFPPIAGTTKVLPHYKSFFSWCKEAGYKRATTLIENTNIAMLKMAMHCGYRIIGIRNFEGSILCELLVNF